MRSGNGTHPERRVAAAADWDPRYGDRTQLLAFTAQDLDAGGIWELLDSCLLTGEELAAGEAGCKALPDDFADLLNPVPLNSSARRDGTRPQRSRRRHHDQDRARP
jgi:hypothetical protein